MLCKYEDDSSQDENESPKKKDKDKRYMYPHGGNYCQQEIYVPSWR